MAVVVVSIGIVLGAEKLKPISWRDWAGEIERDGGARNPYMSLEERHGFWDIRVSLLSCFCGILREDIRSRAASMALLWYYLQDGELTRLQAKRKEFANWMRGSDAVAPK